MRLKHPRAKGNRVRLKLIRELENQGFECEPVEKTARWAKNKDFFKLWDVVAIHIDGRQKFLQSKTNVKPNLKPYKEFREKYKKLNVSMEIWIYHNRKKGIKAHLEKIIIENL